MPATPRDLLKPRQQRIHEVMESVQLQAGQPNAQQIISGLVVSPETTRFAISAGEYCPNGVALPVAYAGSTANNINAGATTSASTFCYVLIELEGNTVIQTVSALTTGTPVLPPLTATRIAIAYLSLPNSFTVGATTVTAGMCVPIKYDAGYISPIGGY